MRCNKAKALSIENNRTKGVSVTVIYCEAVQLLVTVNIVYHSVSSVLLNVAEKNNEFTVCYTLDKVSIRVFINDRTLKFTVSCCGCCVCGCSTGGGCVVSCSGCCCLVGCSGCCLRFNVHYRDNSLSCKSGSSAFCARICSCPLRTTASCKAHCRDRRHRQT